MRPRPEPPGPGQESVWDYPRPPRLEPIQRHIVVRFAGHIVAESQRPLRFLETSHPPTYYLPPEDVDMDCLHPLAKRSACEWKGMARYFDVVVGDRRASAAAWAYPSPQAEYAAVRGHVAFYAALMDECRVDGELVTPQPGGFYGGWITADLAGPFKGVPGSWGW